MLDMHSHAGAMGTREHKHTLIVFNCVTSVIKLKNHQTLRYNEWNTLECINGYFKGSKKVMYYLIFNIVALIRFGNLSLQIIDKLRKF